MQMIGIEELKQAAKRLYTFSKNRTGHPVDMPLPSMLWIVKRGGGASTLGRLFAEYLYVTGIKEFRGTVKMFEYRLEYAAPNEPFTEMVRLCNELSAHTGYHNDYRGLFCVDIDAWVSHTAEDHFVDFLGFIAGLNDKLLTIFCVRSDNRRDVESIELAISSYLRVETVRIRFPDAGELVTLMEYRFFGPHGFRVTKTAKALLAESVGALSAGIHFNGFKTIENLTEDIIYSILASDEPLSSNGKTSITARMLESYHKDSEYIKRLTRRGGDRRVIGFNTKEDHSK